MALPPELDRACQNGRLLIVWGALPFPLAERPPANRKLAIDAWLARPPGPPSIRLPALPPVTILSLDPTNRLERAFEAAGVPLHVVCSARDVPQGCHNLLKLAGDLATRSGVVLSQAELRELHGDPDKRYLLDEGGRVARDGAVLLLGGEPASQDFQAWWSVLAPTLGVRCFAMGDPHAAWPAGVMGLESDLEALAAALAARPASPAAERETLQGALEKARRALAILEEQAAGHTALTIPAHLRIELEDKRGEVAGLEARLGQQGGHA